MPDAERRRLADTLTTRLVAEINRHLDEWAIVEGLAECGALTAGDRLTGDLLDGVRRIAGDARYAFGPRHGAANVMVRLPECTEAELLDATAFVNRVTQAKWQVLLRHPNAGPKVWAAVVRARPDRVAMWVAKQPRMARCAEVREALCSPEVELYVNQAVMLEAQLRDAGDPVVFDDVLGDLIQVDVARAAAVVPSLPARRRGMITQERLAALLAGAPASSRVALITAVGTITPRETTACTPGEEAGRRQRPRRRR